ncbi:hypothetical protein [uncultured Amnibacterium sp.]|uniref:hypothetical protein n=1 Tax=uncultured Amnibacterium sp. TaxID=1631851 RepID=UPI0035CA1390
MRTEPAPGSDPTPSAGERSAEDDPRSWGDAAPAPGSGARDSRDSANDARLRADKPPHWS